MNTNNLTKTKQMIFEDISSKKLEFSGEYRCAFSTAGQVIAGLSWHINNLSTSTNHLHQVICQLSNEIILKYENTFVNNCNESEKYIYGKYLNGQRNDGKMNRLITCKNINPELRYKFARFGQLLTLLYSRLNYITKIEIQNDENLQQSCLEFCRYLSCDDNSIVSKWKKILTKSKPTKVYGISHRYRSPGDEPYSDHCDDCHMSDYFHHGEVAIQIHDVTMKDDVETVFICDNCINILPDSYLISDNKILVYWCESHLLTCAHCKQKFYPKEFKKCGTICCLDANRLTEHGKHPKCEEFEKMLRESSCCFENRLTENGKHPKL